MDDDLQQFLIKLLFKASLMTELPEKPVGAAWLARDSGVMPMARFAVVSQVGGRRSTQLEDGYRLETYPENMRPDPDFLSNLHFHLRHEVINLEFLSRLFAKVGCEMIQLWVSAEPTGQYARRAAFLYEWLTGETLRVPERIGGNYVDAINAALMVAASSDQIVKVPRWRVNDNLAGTRHFCPTVVKTEAVKSASDLDVPLLFGQLTQEFGEALLLRAAAWMTLRESKASFAIEGEADRSTRIQRFADVLARRTGQGELPLTDTALAEMQEEILGTVTTLTRLGIRQSPVFVGETVRYQELVHYVAPPEADLEQMLEGIRVFLSRTQGQSPVMRSAVAAFAFVYIHPLADGNGRVHRFLINDILRRDGAIPDPVILPISAVITDDSGERRAYDSVLDQVSKPLMQNIRDQVRFASTRTQYPDGVVSNIEFSDYDKARPLWRYPDLGPHVVFISNIVRRTITEQMREESKYLRSHSQARLAIKEIVEMPDHQADRLLRSIEQNKGQLSNVLAKEMPVLTKPEIWTSIIEAVANAMREEGPIDSSVIGRYHPTQPAGK
ncbi:Fic family protein [Pseudomonas sp. P2757]|uniref:Fic family protein n=1 Tax=unclassified Pseudomonas TaxID=196821 RepID=UPI003B59C3F5